MSDAGVRETKSTCPYCGVGCGHACGGPLRGERERRRPSLARHD